MSSPSDPPPLLRKYPRTPHLEGSSLQAGDDHQRVPVASLAGQGTVAYEEKVDGANAAFRFDGAGELLLQSRGHYLAAGDRNAPRERDWTLLKDWLAQHRDALLERFEDRYVVFGEWLAVTHSAFYDRLPTYFLEFDILDLAGGRYLDTPSRRALCAGLPIHAVPVLARRDRPLPLAAMLALVGPSVFRTPDADPPVEAAPADSPAPTRDGPARWRDNLRRACALVGDDYDRRIAKMDGSGLSEGLYVKVERDGEVVGRYKWVRPGFTQTILSADEHWQSRFPVPNLLDGPVPEFPTHLVRTGGTPPRVPYDPDQPWGWLGTLGARRAASARGHSLSARRRSPLGTPAMPAAVAAIEDFLPRHPDWALDWEGIDAAFPWIRKLRGSTQDPEHHAEADVWTHVAMVASELAAAPEWRAAAPAERLELFAAALLHDVCKPETRRVEEGGRITNRGHSRAGANEARQVLWRMGWPIPARERVCAMIRAHQAPFWLLEREAWDADRILVETSLSVPNRVLAVLAEADARGRISRDRQRIVDAVELFREAARDRGCFDAPFPFGSDHARFRYFRSPEARRPDDDPVWDDTDPCFTVTVMSGLPAMGKSTWIRRETAPGSALEGQPVVSLDGLREELDADPAGDQGRVVQAAKERARALLRERRAFVWDGTNLSRQLRGQTVALAADYGARVRIAYVEAPEEEMRARNRARPSPVPDQAIARMLRRWEVPTPAECHELHVARAASPARVG